MNASVDSVFPEKYRILSGSALKMIAIITMLIDHIGAVILSMYPPAQKVLFTLLGREYSVYLIFRDIGRVLSPAGRFPAYQEPFPLWTESPSFCSDLRDSLEPDVHKHTVL